ncbi:phosphatidate cytidylyltransferase [Gorillibacterium timonense]|uniref:phosphatidate cytidylyltransferase n=1 Tax=Gorillibacterium timonense TaxID=1689269 RepID=UPI00071DD21B|nr:phosphatidate cytidylyltransferase [Gorillibacterium timonense]
MRTRIITGVLAGGAFIGMLAIGGYAYAGLITLMALIGYDEFVRMNKLGRVQAAVLCGYGGLALFLVPAFKPGLRYEEVVTPERLIWFLLFLLLSVTVFTKNRTTVDQAAYLFLGAAYLGIGYRYMIETRLTGEHGLFWTLFVFLAIWASDAGAYFTGSLIGKAKLWTLTKLWPAISPNKTVEGAVGGIVIAVIVTISFHFAKPEWVSLGHAAAMGVVIAVVGTLGDLIQSAYKRVKGVKDSGTLLPGHGGILDRTDSWLIVFPFLHLIGLL